LKNVSHQLGFSLQRYYEILCVVPRHCLYALVFGVLITGLGLFVGLQISPVVGKVLAFPFVLSACFSGTGFGNFSPVVVIALFVATTLFWSGAFLLLRTLKNALFGRNSHTESVSE
jgi:hypothetical protein